MSDAEYSLDDDGKSYIQVSDDMRLMMSPRNWQLQKKMIAKTDTKKQKAGDISFTSFRYYVSLESALKDIVHIKTAKESFNTAQGLSEANGKVIAELCKAFSPKYVIKEQI